MRKKGLKVLGLVMSMSLSMSLLSYAGEWKQDNIGKWYQNDDGTYPVSQWKWIEFNNGGLEVCYYFNENGYLIVNATTPDNYMVNEDGAWIENGLIVTRPVGSSTENTNVSTENSTSQNAGNTIGGLSEYDKQFDVNNDGVLDEREAAIKNYYETNDFNIGRGSGLRDWQ